MVDYRENYYNVCCKRVILLKTLAWTRVGLLERRLGAHNHHVFSHWSACAKPGKWLSCMYVCMLRVSILPQFLLFFLFVFGTARPFGFLFCFVILLHHWCCCLFLGCVELWRHLLSIILRREYDIVRSTLYYFYQNGPYCSIKYERSKSAIKC